MVVWNSHVAENYYHSPGCHEATCSFHKVLLQVARRNTKIIKIKSQKYLDLSFQFHYFWLQQIIHSF